MQNYQKNLHKDSLLFRSSPPQEFVKSLEIQEENYPTPSLDDLIA